MTQLHLNIEFTEHGNAFFTVYNVVGNSKRDGETKSLHVFAQQEKAVKYMEYAKPVYKELYEFLWIREEIVWID